MPNIFLAPRANESSRENFESSILVGRAYKELEPYFTDEEKQTLLPYPMLRVWGTKEPLRSRWEKMRPGDYVLFYADHSFYYSARVVLTKFDPALGEAIWGLDIDKVGWSCLFFLDQLREAKIPLKTVQQLAGYQSTWDSVRGFMPLNPAGMAAIIEKFGSVEAFLGQTPESFQVIERILENTQDETIENEKSEVVDKERLLATVLAYKDSGVSHTIDSFPHKVRIENRAQKKNIAELENNACQICNWSLEWTNKKGVTCYRIDVDHIIDKSKGGGEEASNLWVLCPNCHAKKTMGVITIDPEKRLIQENGVPISLHHDVHLGWV